MIASLPRAVNECQTDDSAAPGVAKRTWASSIDELVEGLLIGCPGGKITCDVDQDFSKKRVSTSFILPLEDIQFWVK